MAKNSKAWVKPINTGRINFLEYYDERKLDKARQRFMQDFDMSKAWRAPYRTKWLKYYQMYRSYNSDYRNVPAWQSAVFIPKPFEAVEVVRPRLTGALYDIPPCMVAIESAEKYRESSRFVEMLIDTRANQTNEYAADDQTFAQMLIYGTAWQKIVYDYKRDYEGTRLVPCDIFDIYPDPAHAEPENMRFIFHRDVKHICELQSLESQGLITGVSKIDAGGSNNYFSALDRLTTVIGRSGNDPEKQYHEMIEMYGKWYDEEVQRSFDVVMTVVDRKHVVRFEESPYYLHDEEFDYFYALMPFVKFVDVPLAGEVYGIGEIEMIETLALALNDTHNMKADAMQYAIAPVYMAILAGLEEPDSIDFSPGSIIPVLPTAGQVISPIQKDMAWTSAYNEEESIKQSIRDATGIQRPVSGSEGNIRKTAREAISLLEESSQPIKQKLQRMSIGPLANRSKMRLGMERQFSDEKVLAQIFEADQVKAFVEISPRKLQWDGILRLQAASLYGHKGVVADRRMRLAEVMMGMPGADQWVNWPELARGIAEILDISPDKIIIEQKAQPPAPVPVGPQQPVMPQAPGPGQVPPEAILAAMQAQGLPGSPPPMGLPNIVPPGPMPLPPLEAA